MSGLKQAVTRMINGKIWSKKAYAGIWDFPFVFFHLSFVIGERSIQSTSP